MSEEYYGFCKYITPLNELQICKTLHHVPAKPDLFIIPVRPYSIVVAGVQSMHEMQATRVSTILNSHLSFAGLAPVM